MGKALVREIEAKGIIVKSNLPDADFVVNPYIGCGFACSYCYASFMGRFNGYGFDDWGQYVLVKANAPKLFAKEIQRKAFTDPDAPSILFSSVTDPYQPVEKEYALTRKMLAIAVEFQYPGEISVLTKAPLVIKDMDLFTQLPKVSVGITVNTIDTQIKSEFEKFTPSDEERLKALRDLNAQGINTYAFVGPVFPHYYDKPEVLFETLQSIKEAGTINIYIEHLNLNTKIKGRLDKLLGRQIKKASTNQIASFNEVIHSECNRLGFNLLYGEPIIHSETKKGSRHE